jgi:hypothetical protein
MTPKELEKYYEKRIGFGKRPELESFNRWKENCQHPKICLNDEDDFMECENCGAIWNYNRESGYFEIQCTCQKCME